MEKGQQGFRLLAWLGECRRTEAPVAGSDAIDRVGGEALR